MSEPTTATRRRRLRVRGDEIAVGDLLVVRTPRGSRVVEVDAEVLTVDVTRTERGQRRIGVKAEGFGPFGFAPHSKHTVRRAVTA